MSEEKEVRDRKQRRRVKKGEGLEGRERTGMGGETQEQSGYLHVRGLRTPKM